MVTRERPKIAGQTMLAASAAYSTALVTPWPAVPAPMARGPASGVSVSSNVAADSDQQVSGWPPSVSAHAHRSVSSLEAVSRWVRSTAMARPAANQHRKPGSQNAPVSGAHGDPDPRNSNH